MYKYVIYSIDELKIVDTWEQCSTLTKGIKGKKFKKFIKDDIEGIKSWFISQIQCDTKCHKQQQVNRLKELLNTDDISLCVEEYTVDKDSKLSNKKKKNLSKEDILKIEDEINSLLDDNIFAFVDGSYKKESGEYSYGLCIAYKNQILYESKNKYKDINGMWQINGELKGALLACNFAKNNNIKKIYIGYDYAGIEKFATKEWKSNKECIQYYVEQMNSYMKDIDIQFFKIPSHTGIEWNEYADRLSKAALGIV